MNIQLLFFNSCKKFVRVYLVSPLLVLFCLPLAPAPPLAPLVFSRLSRLYCSSSLAPNPLPDGRCILLGLASSMFMCKYYICQRHKILQVMLILNGWLKSGKHLNSETNQQQPNTAQNSLYTISLNKIWPVSVTL